MDPNAHRRPRSGSACGSNLSDRGRERTFRLRIVSAETVPTAGRQSQTS
jgi:hypothetical protein